MAIKEPEKRDQTVVAHRSAVADAARHISATQPPVPSQVVPVWRWSEMVLGLLATAAGLIGLGCAVFGPTVFSYPAGGPVTPGPTSLWTHGIGTPPILIFLAAMIVAALGVSAGTYVQSQGEREPGLVLTCVSAFAVFVGAVLTLPGTATLVVPRALAAPTPYSVGIGIYLAPAAIVAVVAALVCKVQGNAPTSVGSL